MLIKNNMQFLNETTVEMRGGFFCDFIHKNDLNLLKSCE